MHSGKSRVLTLWHIGILLSGVVCGTMPRPAAAQVLYGSVIGTVTDQSDAVIPRAAVTITSKETGLTRSATTDDGGRYSFVNVLPGRYDVKVVAQGFRTFAANDFDVSPN